MPAAWARILPATLPLIPLNTKLAIRDRCPLKLGVALCLILSTLGLQPLDRCGGTIRPIVHKRDNPRVVERAARGDVF